jgi:large subunit ribosomal protein L21
VYAIIQSGGRQVRVSPGAMVDVDHFVGNVGAPFVSGAKVVAVIEGESRGPKIRVFKKKRRKGMRKTRGHRSVYTRLRVKEIVI